jgi:hypothetical protein
MPTLVVLVAILAGAPLLAFIALAVLCWTLVNRTGSSACLRDLAPVIKAFNLAKVASAFLRRRR